MSFRVAVARTTKLVMSDFCRYHPGRRKREDGGITHGFIFLGGRGYNPTAVAMQRVTPDAKTR